MPYDVIVAGGLFFDGGGAPGAVRHLGIRGGRVAVISEVPLDASGCPRVIDARGCWVTPGFVDLHTHYDAEVLAAPSLSESVRHGVTSVVIGSCSISAILSEPEDCSDMFTRVEAVPREQVLPLLRSGKTWTSSKGFVEHLKRLPLGPNVAAFLGHSDLRTRVLGLARAVDKATRPNEAELGAMEALLEEGLNAGLLGLSSMTNPWDKMDGERFRSKHLPSTYAGWTENKRLTEVLRRRGRILQSAPNITTKVNALLFAMESAGYGVRRPLKTTLITMADAKSSRGLHRVLAAMSALVNGPLGGDLRWQTLPVPFEVHSDGVDLVVFEEFGAGEALLHLVDEVARNEMMRDPAYRRRFRADYEKRFSPRVWHRDFHDATIVSCPDASLVGKSIGEVADARGAHPVDGFLDLVVEYGRALRWRTTIANDRPAELAWMMNDPCALIGFADSGAHLRNMAFYSFPLQMLRRVRDANSMSIERAVWRLTGEIADWLDIDAGHLRLGDRADVVVLDPTALDGRLDVYHEAEMDGFPGLVRMVNRSDGIVKSVLVNGRVAFDDHGPVAELGQERGFGGFLAASVRGAGSEASCSLAEAAE